MRIIFRNYRRLAAIGAAGFLLMTSLTGCGGGKNHPTITGAAPTDATRARVHSLYGQSIQSSLYSGAQTLEMAQASGGGASSGDGAASPSATYLGAFFRQKALQHSAAGRSRSRQEDDNTFYFDYYLGLWVETTSSPTKTSYNLFSDEAKTQPAGHILMENPADYDTFPQVYRSLYDFTDGLLKGAHGSSLTITKEDYSGSSQYEDVYADGGKSTGSSVWTSGGDSTYKSREDLADGSWTESVGTFRGNGSGGTRYSSSDGYGAEYTFNADGTGRGKITGKDPGLPATIVWNDNGTTITYADGSKEHYDYGFGYGYATDDGISTDVASATPVAAPE